MRLYPAFALLYAGSILGLAWAHHGHPERVFVALASFSLFVAWTLISAIAAVGAAHRLSRLLAAFAAGRAALEFVFSYVVAYNSVFTLEAPRWVGVISGGSVIIYGLGAVVILCLPRTEQEELIAESWD